jgi:hypothetical protein
VRCCIVIADDTATARAKLTDMRGELAQFDRTTRNATQRLDIPSSDRLAPGGARGQVIATPPGHGIRRPIARRDILLIAGGVLLGGGLGVLLGGHFVAQHWPALTAAWRSKASDAGLQRFITVPLVQQLFCQAESTVYLPDLVGTIMEPGNLHRHFKGVLARAGLPTTVRFHDLRHSCATLLLAQGVPLVVVRDTLGHTQISTTADMAMSCQRPIGERWTAWMPCSAARAKTTKIGARTLSLTPLLRQTSARMTI